MIHPGESAWLVTFWAYSSQVGPTGTIMTWDGESQSGLEQNTWIIKRWAREAGRLPSDAFIDHPPFASEVLGQNGDHPLHWSQDSPVDDHWSVLVIPILPAKKLERNLDIWL